MTERQLRFIAELDDGDVASSAMVMLREINPTYHWCPDWDDIVICDKNPEYECCTCDKTLLVSNPK